MTKSTDRLAAFISQQLTICEGAPGDALDEARIAAMNLYNCSPLEKDDERAKRGLTVEQDSSVRDMVHACLAQITPMLSTDAVVQFEPMGENDEDQARAESMAVEHVVMELNNGFLTFQSAIFDGLLSRNGWCKVWAEDQTDVQEIPIPPDAPTEVVAMLQQPQNPNETREIVGSGDKRKLKVTTKSKAFKVGAVPTENMRFSPNAQTNDVADLGFLAEWMPMTRSDLVERGIDKATVDGLPRAGETTLQGGTKRNRSFNIPSTNADSSQDIIEVYEVHTRFDLDGDGIAELHRALYAGERVLESEVVDSTPYATGSPFLNPHRLTGISLADVLAGVQSTKTRLLRLSLDNAKSLVFSRSIVDPTRVNMDDVNNFAETVRSTDVTAMQPLPQAFDLGPTLMAHMAYQDKLRTERGGAALEMQSAELQIAGETAHGVERQTALREMLTSHMTRNLSETLVRRVYLLVHEYLRKFPDKPLAMKLKGQWQMVDPSMWPKRDRVNVRAGMSAGEKARKAQAMNAIVGYQTALAQAGLDGILVDASSGYNALMDFAAAADVDNPGLYFVHPESPQAQKAAQQKGQQAQQQQAQMQQMVQAQVQIEMQKVQADIRMKQEDLAYRYWSDRLKSETEEAKTVASGVVELQKVQLQGVQRELEGLERAAGGTPGAEGDAQ